MLMTIFGGTVAAAILMFTWFLMIILSPSWSEHYGRRLISHAQAMRDFLAMFRRAREAYRLSYRLMEEELREATY